MKALEVVCELRWHATLGSWEPGRGDGVGVGAVEGGVRTCTFAHPQAVQYSVPWAVTPVSPLPHPSDGSFQANSLLFAFTASTTSTSILAQGSRGSFSHRSQIKVTNSPVSGGQLLQL